MTTYYVGPGGSDAANGLSWANRKLTLNGAEDVPVVAGDIVYVGPGVYREVLTVDVAGTTGNPITYIGDVTGENTDGVGGIVRVTGTNDDLGAPDRSNCFNLPSTRSFRTFRGFMLDGVNGAHISLQASSSSLIVEDCFILQGSVQGAAMISVNGTGTDHIIRRCIFFGVSIQLHFTHTATVSNANHLVENCVTINGSQITNRIDRVGGITFKNCTMVGGNNSVRVLTALAAGQTITVNNCILTGAGTSLTATALGEITEDYNTFFANNTDRSNVSAGTNSVTDPPIFEPWLMKDDYRFPWFPFNLSEWSQIRHKAGTGESTDDLFGLARPTTSAIKSWGAVQVAEPQREITTVRTGTASIKLPQSGRHQIYVPVTNVSTTISVYVQREADYAGTNPQMVIRQPGQSDRTTTDAAAASQWNQLTDTFTPASTSDFVIVELVSNNTATTGNFDVFFDDLTVD